MKKRILSMLLVLVLMATLVPVSASAAVTIYWPVPGHTRLSQGYHANNAIDISDGSINGATVIAAASGTVTHIYLCSNTHNDSYSIQHPESTDCNGFGTGLVIKADDGRIYQYAHMQGGMCIMVHMLLPVKQSEELALPVVRLGRICILAYLQRRINIGSMDRILTRLPAIITIFTMVTACSIHTVTGPIRNIRPAQKRVRKLDLVQNVVIRKQDQLRRHCIAMAIGL